MRLLIYIAVVLLQARLGACAFTSNAIFASPTQTDVKFSCAAAPTTLPDINYGLSDEEFHAWLMDEVSDCPGRNTYSSAYEDSLNAIVQWRRRYRGNPALWKRVFKKERVIKELIESAPIIESVKQVVANNSDESKYTIVDLCSGKGYLSMFLSEILPKGKVERFILVDKSSAIASKETTVSAHHMN